MALYTFLDAFSESIGLASIIIVIVWLVSSLQSLSERVRDPCQTCQLPEARVRLLGSAFLIYVTGVAAAGLYFHILFLLWDAMGALLVDQPINWAVYALLQFYHLFLVVCGCCACRITIVEVYENRKVLNDLWVIARFNGKKYEVAEDVEAQHPSSSPDLAGSHPEVAFVIDEVYYSTSSLPQDENSCKNDQDLNEDITLSRTRTNESDHPTEEPAWSEIDHSVGESMLKAVDSSFRDGNVKCPFWSTDSIWNRTEASRSSNRYQAILNSDGEEIILTLSPTFSDASSEVDELGYVSDYEDQCGLPGVNLREHLEAREKSNGNGLDIIISKCGCVKGDDDGLYCHPKTHPGPQHLRAKPDLEPLDTEEPPSPCDSCSSAHAKSIPTAKRSLARVPITPTSPTADAEEADMERTDVEWNRRDHRRKRNPASPFIIIPPMTSAPHEARSPLFDTDAKHSDGEECTRVPQSDLATPPPLDQEASPGTNNEQGSSDDNPNPNPAPYTYLPSSSSSSSSSSLERDYGLFWRSRQAAATATTAPLDHDSNDDDDDDYYGKANTVSFDDDQCIHVKRSVGNSGSKNAGVVGLAAASRGPERIGRKQ